MTETKETRVFSGSELEVIRKALETPGNTRMDACDAVGIERSNHHALTRALDRAGYDVVLTIKKRSKRP